MTTRDLTGRDMSPPEQTFFTIRLPTVVSTGTLIERRGPMLLVGWCDPRFGDMHRNDWFDAATGYRWMDFDLDPDTQEKVPPKHGAVMPRLEVPAA